MAKGREQVKYKYILSRWRGNPRQNPGSTFILVMCVAIALYYVSPLQLSLHQLAPLGRPLEAG